MLNLLIKDILVQKKTFIGALFYLVFFVVAFQSLEMNMFTAAIVAFVYLLVIGGFAYDDKSKSDIMLNSLPIKRENIVMSKYISLFVYIAIGTIAYIAVSFVISLLNTPIKTYPVTIELIVSAVLAVSLLNSISFPLIFKLGYVKAKVFNMIFFLTFLFGVPLLIDFVSKADSEVTTAVGTFLLNQSDVAIASELLALSLVFLLISYGISVRLYKKREF
ncbi:MAG TPA: ABC-2 transporter permease [Acetivibrio sp.]|nr:ABC-2 transporter permease [Clostridium sp.]HOQ37850.1 ABC-2 transporter permease [Acetivibrio sp.]HPT89991.1 ABC-2 transporter permease [Acetivibrio sp.]HQA58604.1 ABC-2 transporter permease [Acetivibrio sp.]